MAVEAAARAAAAPVGAAARAAAEVCGTPENPARPQALVVAEAGRAVVARVAEVLAAQGPVVAVEALAMAQVVVERLEAEVPVAALEVVVRAAREELVVAAGLAGLAEAGELAEDPEAADPAEVQGLEEELEPAANPASGFPQRRCLRAVCWAVCRAYPEPRRAEREATSRKTIFVR